MKTPLFTKDIAPSIGFLGPVASGKTTFLASMYLDIEANNKETMEILPDNYEAKSFVDSICNQEFRDGILPSPTPDNTQVDYEFKLYDNSEKRLLKSRGFYRLTLTDASGELTEKRAEKGEPEYFDFLTGCYGLIATIDPSKPKTAGKYASYFTNLETKLRTSKQDNTISIAICITKIDLEEYWKYRDQCEEFLKSLISKSVYESILRCFSKENVRCFAVSAVGRYSLPGDAFYEPLDRPNLIPIIIYDKDGKEIIQYRLAHPRRWQPYNVLSPLHWLLDEVDKNYQPFWQKWLSKKTL